MKDLIQSKKSKRIGIFGGSFDPPHRGHLEIARAVVEEGLADEVWMMVSPENPLKQGKLRATEQQRLEMMAIALESLPESLREHIKVSDFETRLPRPSYTVATLRSLKEAYPEDSFHIIIGGDNLRGFMRWRNPEEIARDYGLIVYPRTEPSSREDEEMSQKLPAVVIEHSRILKGVRLFPHSSTEVREHISKGEEYAELLPEGVAEYIRSHALYASEGVDQ